MSNDEDEGGDPLERLVAESERLEDAERRYLEHRQALEVVAEDRDRLRGEVEQIRATIRMLCKVLIARGNLVEGHLKLAERLLRSNTAPPRPRLNTVDNKHQTIGPDIDCASRFHLCQGRCCTLEVDLAAEDIADGVAWHIDEPYRLLHDRDGWCHHIDRATGGCTIYEKRPSTCRTYDCREDQRVWVDFAARLPAPLPTRLRPENVPPFGRPKP